MGAGARHGSRLARDRPRTDLDSRGQRLQPRSPLSRSGIALYVAALLEVRRSPARRPGRSRRATLLGETRQRDSNLESVRKTGSRPTGSGQRVVSFMVPVGIAALGCPAERRSAVAPIV